MGLVEEGAGESALPRDLSCGTPFPPLDPQSSGSGNSWEVWGCLCCLSEDVRSCGPRSMGVEQQDGIHQMCGEGVSLRRTFLLE